MGLLDKLFGGSGDKQPESRPDATPPAGAPAPPQPAADGNAPARRERAKRADPPPQVSSTLPPSEFDPAPQAAAPQLDLPQIDPNSENAELLIAINHIVAGDNAESRDRLYKAILASSFYLVSMPNPDAPEEALATGEVTLSEGQQIQLATIQSPDGKTFLPAFTDLARLQNTLPEKARYIKIPAPNLCRLFGQGPGEGIVINPGNPPSGVITRGEAEILAMNAVPQVGEDGQLRAEAQQQVRIAIGKPTTPPASTFLEAIRTAAQQQPSVREAHVFAAGIEGQPMRLMIGLLVDENVEPEAMQPTFEAIGRAAYDARGETEQFDMMPLHEGMMDSLRTLEGLVYVRSVIV